MEKLKLDISSLSVQIKILTVDGKRFTKSVFDQLQHSYPFDFPYDSEDIFDLEKEEKEIDIESDLSVNCEIIGFVVYKNERHLIFSRKGILYKAKACCTYNYNAFTRSSELVEGFRDCHIVAICAYDICQSIKDSSQIFISI